MANYVKKITEGKTDPVFLDKVDFIANGHMGKLGPDIALRLKFIYSGSPFQQSNLYFLSIVQCMHIYTYIPELLELLVCPP